MSCLTSMSQFDFGAKLYRMQSGVALRVCFIFHASSCSTTSTTNLYSSTVCTIGARPGSSLGSRRLSGSAMDSMDNMDQNLAADLAALQNEASLLEQLRYHEAMRQQMTLPEDIAQVSHLFN
eukprot:scaffold132474_cov36-Prasinocladus_malaysianus.AAC.1